MNSWPSEYRKLEERILYCIQDGAESFENLSLEVFHFQRRYNEPFRQFCDFRRVGGHPSSWEEIPAVPQQAFKMSRLAVFPEEAAVREFRTSGTTGEGFGSHWFSSLLLYAASVDAGWYRADLPRCPTWVLAASPKESPHSSLSQMFEWLVDWKQERFVIRNGQIDLNRLRHEISGARHPILLLGTALAFLNLLEQSTEPLPLPEGSVLMETGGYKGSGRTLEKHELYQQLSDFFSLPMEALVNEYGMTELSSQYYTRGLGEPHRGGHWIRHRIIDPASGRKVSIGETGVLQLFDLANLGSVLAIQTEDLAVECGDGFRLLGRDPAAVARGCSRSADEVLRK